MPTSILSLPGPLTLIAEPRNILRGFDVYIVSQSVDTCHVAAPITMVHTPDGIEPKPFLEGAAGQEFLQAALNCAWEAGLRPAGFHDKPNTLAATERHLRDMRAIAFSRLKLETPNG